MRLLKWTRAIPSPLPDALGLFLASIADGVLRFQVPWSIIKNGIIIIHVQLSKVQTFVIAAVAAAAAAQLIKEIVARWLADVAGGH